MPEVLPETGRSLLAQLLDAVLPDGKGMVVMLQAYFDESGTQGDSPALLVAGYLFEPQRCLALETDWSIALKEAGVSIFHATDCAGGWGEFKDMDRKGRDELYLKLLNLIRRDATVGMVVQVKEADFRQAVPAGWEKRFGGAYAACATLCLQAVGRWCRDNSRDDRVAYFLESGHQCAGEAFHFMEFIAQFPVMRDLYRWHSHTFVSKKSTVPLQTADILAWELNKENVERSFFPRRRPLRKSIGALTDVPTTVMHLEQGRLKKYFASVLEAIDGEP